MNHRPVLTAATATAVLAALAALLLVGEADRSQADSAPAAAGDPAARPDGVTRAPAAAPPPADTVAGSGPAGGLTVLTARQSGLRMHAFGVAESRAADGAAVVGMPPDAEADQEWLVLPSATGELVLRSLLAPADDAGPLLLTTDPDDSVYLQHGRSAGPQEDPAQLWTFAGDPARTDAAATDSPFRIAAQRGGCLLDNGYGERLTVGSCEDPGAWWTSDGTTAAAGADGPAVRS
ncbi:hypothetical protein [Kitasatospora sp. MBT63]|uniref:hypothetical protein n=1 Tax=Kitasatospora sp. MBT63 TaxID=1444768 RepID=UPI00053A86E1|nr:hypothetical protein [Kitasatospora sp. MBT63]